ncbi:hypothetical protein ELH49_09085 [Rhizobium ruizarguesonis]|jgi:hypothetical protein|uniref:hypothetical protein n=1 Tax=Rhizobium ruizarguesonis TaxID=2081791 RepID=UPI0010326CD7|nr:hypothetical protein [Rhizobium ruizarguesonis]TBB44179.1 hypothetical protein ELH49_09085 [Rhizobium ruizarguesonis]
MSYCRWSSDNFKCDVYAYEDATGGYKTHVASNRILGDCPPGPDYSTIDEDGWAEHAVEAEKARSAFLADCGREPIDHVYAGRSFSDDDLASFLSRMEHLKAEGFYVPDCVFDAIREEISEGGAT